VSRAGRQERVQRGATLLDQRIPDWYRRVNPLTVNIPSNANCVLGQLGYGDPYSVSDELGLDNMTRWMSGFTANTPDLDEYWAEEIRKRREEEDEVRCLVAADRIKQYERTMKGTDDRDHALV
jgi:hypothetical protein